MLDAKFVESNLELVAASLKKRRSTLDISSFGSLASKRRELIQESETLKATKNSVSSEIALIKRNKGDATALMEEMKSVAVKIKDLDEALSSVEADISEFMLSIPNLLDESVPEGKDSEENIEIRKFGSPTEFSFSPLPHWELGEKLNILDQQAAGKITGARFMVYRGLGARLERAVMNLMLDTHTSKTYKEVFTPFMVNRDSMYGTGQLPKFEEDMFAVKDTNYFLIPTAEVPVTNLHRGEILKESDLPIHYTAYSACFRAEGGSAGRDTRGIIRQHQFNKVELVKFCTPETSVEEHEKLTSDAEAILKLLCLPYRVVCLCSGDVGFSSAKTYDIEVYMPSYGKYVEISSCSNFKDFQARRANIKYRDQNGKPQFVHTLNGSGLAIGRTVAAIMENYQNEDGSITVPEALVKYMNTDIIR